jgi:hypothetical protein
MGNNSARLFFHWDQYIRENGKKCEPYVLEPLIIMLVIYVLVLANSAAEQAEWVRRTDRGELTAGSQDLWRLL